MAVLPATADLVPLCVLLLSLLPTAFTAAHKLEERQSSVAAPAIFKAVELASTCGVMLRTDLVRQTCQYKEVGLDLLWLAASAAALRAQSLVMWLTLHAVRTCLATNTYFCVVLRLKSTNNGPVLARNPQQANAAGKFIPY